MYSLNRIPIISPPTVVLFPYCVISAKMCVCQHVTSLLDSCVQSYEQAFEKIKEATGITDIDQLVTKFIEGMSISIYRVIAEL